MRRTRLHILFFMIALLLLLSLSGCEFIHQNYDFLESIDLDRDYEWYQTQMNTGPASHNNCGPSSVSMAIEFASGEEVDVAEIRNMFYKEGGWWYPADITQALYYYHVDYTVKSLRSKEQIMASLSQGCLVLINLNMTELKKESDNSEERYDRYYTNVTGHFIVLKGYTEDHKWFMVYDPNNWTNDYYSDGTPKGKNRLYNVDEVFGSMASWWPRYIEIM